MINIPIVPRSKTRPAGVFGYSWVGALHILGGLSFRNTLLLANLSALAWLGVYFYMLESPEKKEEAARMLDKQSSNRFLQVPSCQPSTAPNPPSFSAPNPTLSWTPPTPSPPPHPPPLHVHNPSFPFAPPALPPSFALLLQIPGVLNVPLMEICDNSWQPLSHKPRRQQIKEMSRRYSFQCRRRRMPCLMGRASPRMCHEICCRRNRTTPCFR